MRTYLYTALCLSLVITTMLCSCGKKDNNDKPISQQEMAKIYEQIKTPSKYGLVMVSPKANEMTDSPTIFRYANKWYMTYLLFDGKGYETKIASSDDLLHWDTLGCILSRRDKGWDMAQRGGYPALVNCTWGGDYEIERFDNRYWMTYLGGSKSGYETTPLSIGLAYSTYPNLANEWQSDDVHILSPSDSDAQWFELNTQYKSAVIRDNKRLLGHDFLMFYNASGTNAETNITAERIGIAFSDDMTHWQRYENNPVVSHEDSNTISGDAHIQLIGDIYVMFYFRAFDPSKPYQAYNTFACSRDLIHWYDWQGTDLIYPTEEYDARYAHKSYLIHWNGVTYHFYCAVNAQGQRGIALATSKPLGTSAIQFPNISE